MGGRQRVRRAHHGAVEKRELARGSEEVLCARIIAGHDDLGRAQPQIERVEQRRVTEHAFRRQGQQTAHDSRKRRVSPAAT